MAKAKAKKGGPLKVDFTGVEGKRTNLPDNDYLVEIEDVELKEGSGDHPYFAVTMVVQSGKFKGQKVWDNFSTSPGALWKLRAFLEVLGQEVPDGEHEIDKDEMIGTQLVVVTAQEKYKNDDGDKKVAVRVVDFYSADDFQEKDAEDDDDEPAPKSKKKDKAKDKKASKKSKKDDDDDDDADSDDDDDSDSDDDDDETPEEKKKRLRKERRAARKAGKGDDDSDDDDKPAKKKGKKSKDDDDDDDSDDDDDDDKKSKSKKSKKKGGDKVSADTVNDADEKELKKIVKENDLEVDLSEAKTLRKKQALVIDALESADLLEEDDD